MIDSASSLLSIVILAIGGFLFIWFITRVFGLDGPGKPWDPPV